MTKSNKQINKEVSTGMAQETTLAVVDYRMGQLETAVRDGFEKHDRKLDTLTNTFATKEELAVITRQLDNYRWYFRAMFTALTLAVAAEMLQLLVKK
jgi:hypothetical protein